MFTNKSENGRNNICGLHIAKHRKQMRKSQRELADDLQRLGLDIDKNAIQRIEAGKRFVTDIELVYISKALKLPYEEIRERLGDLTKRGVAFHKGQSLLDLYHERVPLYEKYAEITVDCCNKTIREIVTEIAGKVFVS